MAMKTKSKSKPTAKPDQVLAHARKLADQGADAATFWNALFGVGGYCGRLFSTEAERTQFAKTDEWRQVFDLMATLDDAELSDPEFAELAASANGAISVRIPKSLHAALLREAKNEGVSLNQLCAAKLSRQLAAAVS